MKVPLNYVLFIENINRKTPNPIVEDQEEKKAQNDKIDAIN